MYPRVGKRLRECVRERRYVITIHAEEEMDNDDLSIFDVERAILTGDIIERQQDREAREWKYLIRCQTIDGTDIVVVAKLGPTGKMVIITVFSEA